MTINEQIAEIASTSIENAKLIRNYIDEEGDLDWSECTARQLKVAVLQARIALGILEIKEVAFVPQVFKEAN
jgi:hypothetical protein